MNKIKKVLIYGIIFCALFGSFLSIDYFNQSGNDNFFLEVAYEQTDEIQFFYSESEVVNEADSIKMEAVGSPDYKEYTFTIPSGMKYIRIDFGRIEGNSIKIKEMGWENQNEITNINPDEFDEYLQSYQKSSLEKVEDGYEFANEDPYVLFSINDLQQQSNVKSMSAFAIVKLILFAILSGLITLFIRKFVYLRDIYAMVMDILHNRRLLLSLAKNDFKVRFAGSYFGLVWAFVQPICTILVFWFVFQLGFRSGAVEDVPFFLWLSSGIIPWFFFSDSWNGATSTYLEYSYLVKKVVFKIEILPLVKILSAFFVHAFFVLFLCGLFLINGESLSINVLGVFYYILCLGFYVVGLSFITSSIVVFFKDLTQIISIVLQFGMWLTPIMWQTSMFSEGVIKIMRFNPMFYIIEGYRSCFIGDSIMPDIGQTIYFWLVSMLLFVFGIALFRRLKPHFADVL